MISVYKLHSELNLFYYDPVYIIYTGIHFIQLTISKKFVYQMT